MATGFLTSSSVSLPNNSSTVTLTGSVDASFVSSGTAVFIDGVLFEGISGTLYDGSGNSTIELRSVYTGVAIVAGELVSFNTIEGLRDAIRRARDITDDASQIQTTFGIVLTSINATETIVINGVDVVVTPYGYLSAQVSALIVDAGTVADDLILLQGDVDTLTTDVSNLQASVTADKLAAANSALLSEKWASELEDVLVDATNYSSKHYSLKAAADEVLTNADAVATAADVILTNADVVLTHADVVLTAADVISSGTSETNSGISAAAALASSNQAESWADEDENVVVLNQVAGTFSAKHWAAQAQATATGALIYRGIFSAAAGTFPVAPTLGDFYKISVAGTLDPAGPNELVMAVGDHLIYNDTTWDKVDNTESVTSVAGKSGAVVLVKADVGLSSVDDTSDINKPISSATQTALDGKVDDGQVLTNVPAGAVFTDTTYVSSDFTHNGLTGVVANEHIDWTLDQGVTNIHSGNYTDTTYTVGDGGLSEINFTSADNIKLDGIAADADVNRAISDSVVTTSSVISASSTAVKAAYDRSWAHANTSALNGVYGSADDAIKIDTITVDSNGHITAIATGVTSDLALGSTSVTAYRGDLGTIAYDHSQVAHAPSGAEVNRTISDSVITTSSVISASATAAKAAYDRVWATTASVALKSDIASPTFTGTVTSPAYETSSDQRLKIVHNVCDVDNMGEILTVCYDLKDGTGYDQIGYLAQDVERYLPEAVSTNGETGMMSVNYTMVHTGKIAKLESQVRELTMLVDQLLGSL